MATRNSGYERLIRLIEKRPPASGGNIRCITGR